MTAVLHISRFSLQFDRIPRCTEYEGHIYSVSSTDYEVQIFHATLHGRRAAVEPYTTRKPLPSLLVWYTGCACWASWFFVVVVVIHYCYRYRRVYNAIDTVWVVKGLISLLYRVCTKYLDIKQLFNINTWNIFLLCSMVLYTTSYVYPTCPSIPAKKRSNFGHYAQGNNDVITVEHDWPMGFWCKFYRSTLQEEGVKIEGRGTMYYVVGACLLACVTNVSYMYSRWSIRSTE